MDYAPSIDWPLALRLSAAGAKDLPDLDERSLKQLVADLRVTARRAGEIAGAFLNVDSAGATAVKVVDWNGWGTAVRGMVETVVTELGMPHRPDGPVDWARRRINAVLLGAGIRAASRRLLGQYDAYTGADTLYLVAPTIVAHERDHGFAPADFRLWVALHEQTHALQFRAAPWLREWIGKRAREVFEDDASPIQGLAAWARTGDLASLLVSGDAGESLTQLVGVMTFLEGHADYTADIAGRPHIPGVAALRKAFTRKPGASGLGRISPSFDKSAQYRDGLAFCREVAALRGRPGLRAAFAEPANLPTPAEISDPRAWVRRVHG